MPDKTVKQAQKNMLGPTKQRPATYLGVMFQNSKIRVESCHRKSYSKCGIFAVHFT